MRLNDTDFVVENAEMEGFFLDDVGYADDGIEMVEENSIEQDDLQKRLMINILGQKLW